MAAAAGKASSGKTTIRGGRGQKPVTFQKGGLHRSLGVPEGQKIPAAKMAAAKRGDYGPTAQKQANLAGMLAAGRKTAAANRAKSKRKAGARRGKSS